MLENCNQRNTKKVSNEWKNFCKTFKGIKAKNNLEGINILKNLKFIKETNSEGILTGYYEPEVKAYSKKKKMKILNIY